MPFNKQYECNQYVWLISTSQQFLPHPLGYYYIHFSQSTGQYDLRNATIERLKNLRPLAISQNLRNTFGTSHVANSKHLHSARLYSQDAQQPTAAAHIQHNLWVNFGYEKALSKESTPYPWTDFDSGGKTGCRHWTRAHLITWALTYSKSPPFLLDELRCYVNLICFRFS